jgi:hypothetical protein
MGGRAWNARGSCLCIMGAGGGTYGPVQDGLTWSAPSRSPALKRSLPRCFRSSKEAIGVLVLGRGHRGRGPEGKDPRPGTRLAGDESGFHHCYSRYVSEYRSPDTEFLMAGTCWSRLHTALGCPGISDSGKFGSGHQGGMGALHMPLCAEFLAGTISTLY